MSLQEIHSIAQTGCSDSRCPLRLLYRALFCGSKAEVSVFQPLIVSGLPQNSLRSHSQLDTSFHGRRPLQDMESLSHTAPFSPSQEACGSLLARKQPSGQIKSSTKELEMHAADFSRLTGPVSWRTRKCVNKKPCLNKRPNAKGYRNQMPG